MRQTLLAVLLFACLFSCKKSSDDGSQNTGHITSGPWKYNTGGIDQDRNGTIDIPFSATPLVMPCMTDNTGLFNADGTGTTDEGPTKCDPGLPQSSSFTWSFQNNETELQVAGNGLFGLGGNLKIRELTHTAFEVSKDTTIIFGGLPMTVGLIFELKH